MPKLSRNAPEPPLNSSDPPRRTPQSNGKHPGGRPPTRPSAYDEQALSKFFHRMVTGMGLKKAANDKTCPHHVAVYQRLFDDGEFFTRFLRVREAQQGALVDETYEIAAKATPDNWQVARLKITTIQWGAARLASKVYGEKSQLNVIVNDALSDRLTAALKRQRELSAAGSVVQIEGVAEPVVAEGSDAQPGLDKSVDIGDNG